MNELQREIVEALTEMGYKLKYNSTYGKSSFPDINVGKIETVKQLMERVFKDGEQKKVWDIKTLLEVV